MKKLKANQVGPWCSYCAPKTNRSVYVQNGFAGKFSCETHKLNLLDDENSIAAMDKRYTEADNETWGRL